jgi:hypothetical protein
MEAAFSRQKSRDISWPIDDSLIETLRSTSAMSQRAAPRRACGVAVEDILAQVERGLIPRASACRP